MSRTRLIRPEFFSDERMASLSVTTRLAYIGLWTLCDDAGYFEYAPRQIAAELFRWDGPAKRLRAIEKALTELEETQRVKRLECGEHAVIATVPEYAIQGGNHSYQYQKQHRSRCSTGRVTDRSTYQYRSESVSVVESESVSNSAHARPSKLRDAAVAVGGFVGNLAAAKL